MRVPIKTGARSQIVFTIFGPRLLTAENCCAKTNSIRASPQVGVTPSGNTAMLASHLRGKSFEAGSAHMSLGPSQAGVNNDNHSRFDKGASENAVPTVCGTTIRWRGPQILHILRVM